MQNFMRSLPANLLRSSNFLRCSSSSTSSSSCIERRFRPAVDVVLDPVMDEVLVLLLGDASLDSGEETGTVGCTDMGDVTATLAAVVLLFIATGGHSP